MSKSAACVAAADTIDAKINDVIFFIRLKIKVFKILLVKFVLQKYGGYVSVNATDVSKTVNYVSVRAFLAICCGIMCLFAAEVVPIGINVVILRSFLI